MDKIKTVYHQHEYTGYVALMLLGKWVSLSAHPYVGLRGGWGV